jgi:hypothetical protein
LKSVPIALVGVDREDDPDLPGVHEGRDPGVVAIAVDQPVHDVEGHLQAHVLVRVGQPVEEDLGLVLVDRDVVRDLDRPDRPALVALADGDLADDRGVGRDLGVDVGDHLRVGVVALPAVREVRRCRGCGSRGGDGEEDRQAQEPGADTSAHRSGHAVSIDRPSTARHPPNGHRRRRDLGCIGPARLGG